MLTPPEASGSPIAGPRDGPGSTIVNGGATASEDSFLRSSASKEQQPFGIVEGVWDRLGTREGSTSQKPTPSWAAANTRAPPPVDDKVAIQQQIALANQAHVDRQISVEVAKLVASFRTDDAASTLR